MTGNIIYDVSVSQTANEANMRTEFNYSDLVTSYEYLASLPRAAWACLTLFKPFFIYSPVSAFLLCHVVHHSQIFSLVCRYIFNESENNSIHSPPFLNNFCGWVSFWVTQCKLFVLICVKTKQNKSKNTLPVPYLPSSKASKASREI